MIDGWLFLKKKKKAEPSYGHPKYGISVENPDW